MTAAACIIENGRCARGDHPTPFSECWDDEPCMCGTRFTCMADEHLPCDNCGGNPTICDCDES